jgi:hypothetical protein
VVVQLYDELLVGDSLPTCDCWPTYVNISQDIYLLAPDSSRKLGVIIADVRLQVGNITAVIRKERIIAI